MSFLAPLDIGIVMGLLFAGTVLALALAFRLLDFPDLTVEASFPLGAASFAVVVRNGGNVWLAVLLAMAVGALAGALTGFLHARFKINKFLAGILVIAISYSLSLRIMGASNIGLLQLPSLFEFVEKLDRHWTTGIHPFKAGLLAGLLAIIAICLLLALSSKAGLRLRVAGSNPVYARNLGIGTTVSLIVGLAITNSLAALSGVLLAMHQGFVDASMGQGVLILALAAMTIGERLLPERKLPFPAFVVLGAIIGSVAYQVIVAYAVRAGLAPTDLRLATAMLVLIVVALRATRDSDLFQIG